MTFFCTWCGGTVQRNAVRIPADELDTDPTGDDLPFEVVGWSDRSTPLQAPPATRCAHDRAYLSDMYCGDDPHWVCADCGLKSHFAHDLGPEGEGGTLPIGECPDDGLVYVTADASEVAP